MVIECIQLIEPYIIRDTHAVIPAQAGIQQNNNAFCLNPLASGLRRNDVEVFSFAQFHSE
jgi:hypothetical protein